MPNWCNNTVELFHEDPAMIKRAEVAFNDGKLLNEFIPLPAELQDTTAPVREVSATTEELIEKYGAADWYSWCVGNWGTKWDISPYGCEISDDGVLIGSFDSPWGPPTAAYEKLEELGFSVKAYYHESGMGFCGLYEDGIDDYYELGEMNSDEVADTIPSELDEMFCISENLAMWEEENEENEDE
jgi:hypothetical protein